MNRPVRRRRLRCLLLAAFLLLTSLLLPLALAACSTNSSSASTPAKTLNASQITPTASVQNPIGSVGQLIQGIASATTAEKRQQAVLGVIQSGYSLGFADASGKQLNGHTPAAPISLGPVGLEAYAMLAADGAGRPLGSVIEFLKASGVKLEATQKVIDAASLLPEIQKYVDWSFKNQNDPKASLGLLLASGTTLQIPASAPRLSADTWVSPLAGLLLMSDILIGVPADTPAKTDAGSPLSSLWSGLTRIGSSLALLWSAQPVAASGVQDTAKALQGLITVVSPFLPEGVKIPDALNTILAAFALGDRIVLRTVDPASLSLDPMPNIRRIDLKPALNQGVKLVPVAMLIPSRKILQGITMKFTIDLVAPSRALGSAAGTLYPDADARLESFQGQNPSVQLDGHRLLVTGRPPVEPAGFSVIRSLARNDQNQTALLYATAEVELPQLADVLAKCDDELSKMGFLKQSAVNEVLPREKVEKYYKDIESGLKVAALAYPVVLLPRDQNASLAFETAGTLVSGLPNRFKPLPGDLEKTWPLSYEWVWEWGDGSAQTVSPKYEPPIHTYEKPGTYVVRFSARNSSTKAILSSGEQAVEIKDLPAIIEKVPGSIQYHLFAKTDAQIPFLLQNQLAQSELWILQLASFEAPEPSWVAFPTFRVVYRGQVLNYSPPSQAPVYWSRTVSLQIRYANELMKKDVSYAHKQDTGTLLGNEWIVSNESNKKQYATILQQAAANKQSVLVENSLDDTHVRYIYNNSPKSGQTLNNGYIAACVERYDGCIIDISMNYPAPNDDSVRQVLNAVVEYAHTLARKAEGNAARYIAAFK